MRRMFDHPKEILKLTANKKILTFYIESFSSTRAFQYPSFSAFSCNIDIKFLIDTDVIVLDTSLDKTKINGIRNSCI